MHIEDVVEGKEVKYERGGFFMVERPIEKAGQNNLACYIQDNMPLTLDHINRIIPFYRKRPKSRLTFLDIETCGLGRNNPIFSVAFSHLYPHPSSTCLFARDYSEEGPIFRYFFDMLKEDDVLITYNGTSFDLPRMTDRAVQNGIILNGGKFKALKEVLGERHVDLYSKVRSGIGKRLPDCKLQTTEKHIFGYSRKGDISGERIPLEYRKYVDGEDNLDKIKEIIDHSILDTISLAALFIYLARR